MSVFESLLFQCKSEDQISRKTFYPFFFLWLKSAFSKKKQKTTTTRRVVWGENRLYLINPFLLYWFMGLAVSLQEFITTVLSVNTILNLQCAADTVGWTLPFLLFYDYDWIYLRRARPTSHHCLAWQSTVFSQPQLSRPFIGSLVIPL